MRRLLELGGLEPAVPLPMLPDAIDQHAPVPKTPHQKPQASTAPRAIWMLSAPGSICTLMSNVRRTQVLESPQYTKLSLLHSPGQPPSHDRTCHVWNWRLSRGRSS